MGPGKGTQFILFFLTQYKNLNFLGPTFCLFCIQLWSWERLHVGRLDFGRPHVDLAPPPAHALHDADVDVGDGDLPEAVHDGLPAQPPAEQEVEPEVELALPFGCRWRVPLTRVHNPSGVLLLYRNQLDAQTPDQVMVYVKVYGSILISFIFP